MHYRFGKVKREHSMIKDVLPLFIKISQLEQVSSIIPGRIKPIVGNYSSPVIELKVKTASGFKCIAKSGRSVQEVFIVTDVADEVIEILRKMKVLEK
jgi:hypothetical protein